VDASAANAILPRMTMPRTLAVLSLLVAQPLLAAPTTGTAIGDEVPAFKATAVDVSGNAAKPRDFDSQTQKKITTYLFLGTQCPATAAYLDRIRALDEKYHAKGVDFVYVYPNKTDTSEAKTSFHKSSRLPGPMIDDQGGTIARALGAQHTSETLLVAKDGRLLYRGAIDDSREPTQVKTPYLATALDQALAGKPIATTTTDVQA
jgi:peroxiredoxin